LSKLFVLEDINHPVSYALNQMVQMLREKGINNEKVLNVFRKIDRKFFLNYEL
jgi:protein-L-isoaspartate O-methyltransferase